MKNKRGVADTLLTQNLAYILIELVFFIVLMFFILSWQDGAARLEDFYAKEISGIVNLASPGEEIYLDVTPVTQIAIKNGKSLSEVFIFDNANNKIIVSAKPNSGVSFGYFNNVDIVDWNIELPSGSADTARLYFKIVENQNPSLNQEGVENE